MSEKELEILKADNKAFYFKMTWIKAGSVLSAGIIIALSFSFWAGGFVREVADHETRIGKLETWRQSNQSSMNSDRAKYNKSIKTE